ncbi:MAG: hypothetical protein HRU15_07285 [Planctomycetes bacterium]|nr:hypothetical protein [Planctomycetota bacterium]
MHDVLVIPELLYLMDEMFDASKDGSFIQHCYDNTDARAFSQKMREQYGSWMHVEQRATNVIMTPNVPLD